MARPDRGLLREKILRRLKNGPLKVTALVELTGHSSSSVRGTLQALRDLDMVENFSPRRENIRGHTWRLTEKGSTPVKSFGGALARGQVVTMEYEDGTIEEIDPMQPPERRVRVIKKGVGAGRG